MKTFMKDVAWVLAVISGCGFVWACYIFYQMIQFAPGPGGFGAY